jgi:hypothetical protein
MVIKIIEITFLFSKKRCGSGDSYFAAHRASQDNA